MLPQCCRCKDIPVGGMLFSINQARRSSLSISQAQWTVLSKISWKHARAGRLLLWNYVLPCHSQNCGCKFFVSSPKPILWCSSIQNILFSCFHINSSCHGHVAGFVWGGGARTINPSPCLNQTGYVWPASLCRCYGSKNEKEIWACSIRSAWQFLQAGLNNLQITGNVSGNSAHGYSLAYFSISWKGQAVPGDGPSLPCPVTDR